MTNHSTTTEAALGPCPKCNDCWALQVQEQQPPLLAKTVTCGRCGFRAPFDTWQARIPAPSVAAGVDTNGLAEWLDMLVTALKASQKYDYNEWGQFIMGAENWADRLRSASLPVEPRDYCKGASCADCVRTDCTCTHHAAPALRDEAETRICRDGQCCAQCCLNPEHEHYRKPVMGGFTCECCQRNMEVRINGKLCNECAGYHAATTPLSTLAKAAAAECEALITCLLSDDEKESTRQKFAAIIERCLSGGGEQGSKREGEK